MKGQTASFVRSYPPIISEKQFDRCREIAKENSTKLGTKENIYLAKSLIVCPVCGSKFQAFSSKVHYSCHNALMSSVQRKLNSLEDHRQCNNNICISIPAMDALLWHVALNKECEYLLGTALDDKAEFEKQIATLNEKIAAIAPRLDDIASKRERIVEAYIEGSISKETKQKKFEELDEQKLNILGQKVEYEQKKEYAQSRIDDIMRLYTVNASDAEEVADNVTSVIKIKEKLEKTATNEDKFRIVHRHILQVQIEKAIITYKFNEKKVKEAAAKFVTFTLYDGTKQYYYFLSNDGKGGHWITSNSDRYVCDDVELTIERKMINRTKLRQRAKNRAKKQEAFDSRYSSDRLYLHGYKEMADYLCMCMSTVQRYCERGFFEDALSQFDKKTHILDAERAIGMCKLQLRLYVLAWQ